MDINESQLKYLIEKVIRIATPNGEGICTPIHFIRKRRIMTNASLGYI